MKSLNKQQIFTLMFLVFITAFNFTATAIACPCPEKPDPQTALQQSTAVFTGKVIGIEDKDPSSATGINLVSFRVNKAWKGVERIRTSVSTAKDTADCGFEFSVGNEYLVYADGKAGNLEVSLCSRTQLLATVSPEELATLGEPIFLPEDEDMPLFILIADYPIFFIVVLVVVAGLVIIILRKIKKVR